MRCGKCGCASATYFVSLVTFCALNTCEWVSEWEEERALSNDVHWWREKDREVRKGRESESGGRWLKEKGALEKREKERRWVFLQHQILVTSHLARRMTYHRSWVSRHLRLSIDCHEYSQSKEYLRAHGLSPTHRCPLIRWMTVKFGEIGVEEKSKRNKWAFEKRAGERDIESYAI